MTDSLPSPVLDDRNFEQLMRDAVEYLRQRHPEWQNPSPSDPGVVLMEAFAVMTEALIGRMNRLPDKAYVEFLRLIGVKLQPPTAARTELQFHLSRPLEQPLEIPRGTRVTSSRGSSGEVQPLFTTAHSITIGAGETDASVEAFGCEWKEAELAGIASGEPGFWVRLRETPLIAPTGDMMDLVVAVEVRDGDQAPAQRLQHDGREFAVWKEVESFATAGDGSFAYLVDRVSGIVSFAPAVQSFSEGHDLSADLQVPGEGRQIRAWYRHGGGVAGNVYQKVLTVLKDPLAGVSVVNPAAAIGGSAAETLENALLRGPQQLHSLRRAVTARDYELLAVKCSGAVSRARAFTKATLWKHASPGTIEVVLVPRLPLQPGEEQQITLSLLHQYASGAALQQVREALEQCRPLGVACDVQWASFKKIHVEARVVVTREQDSNEVRQRVLAALYQMLSPHALDSAGIQLRPFGQSLRSWDVYKIIAAEPGVLAVEQLQLVPDSVPGNAVGALSADHYQPQTWFAGSDDGLFRSVNNGLGWEKLDFSATGGIRIILPAPSAMETPGLVAVLTRNAGDEGQPDHVMLSFSWDCGEHWQPGPGLQFMVNDMAWVRRGGYPCLLLATDSGLYSSLVAHGQMHVPQQLLVDKAQPQTGFTAVAAHAFPGGEWVVAVAARANRGIYLSMSNGDSNSYTLLPGMEKKLISSLGIQQRGPHCYLWAGLLTVGDGPGEGCYRWRITRSGINPEGWLGFSEQWHASSCLAICFDEGRIYAASRKLGVLQLDTDDEHPRWVQPDVNCGLPLKTVGQLQPVEAVCFAHGMLMAGGPEGIHASVDHGRGYRLVSGDRFADELSLPVDWLFCSGEHRITVVTEDEL